MRFPVKYKLASIITVILVPLAAFSIHHYFQMLSMGKENVKKHNEQVATGIAYDLGELVDKSFSVMTVLSRHPALQTRRSDECDRIFREILPSFPKHLNIVAADMDGNNYGTGSGSSAAARRLNYRDKDWFKAARRGGRVVGDLHISMLFKFPAVMLAGPILDGTGKQVGVIGMPLDLTKIKESLDSAYKRTEGSLVIIIDTAGNILAHSLQEEIALFNIRDVPAGQKILSNAAGSIEAELANGIRHLVSFTTVKDTGWKVLVGLPAQKAEALAHTMSRNYMIIFSVIGVFAILASYVLTQRLHNNVSALVGGLKEIEQGNLSFSLHASGRDEFADLARSFNRMADKRKKAEEDLSRSEKFISSVLEGIGEGVVVINRELRIITANRGYCDQAKMSCGDIIGKHCYEVSHRVSVPCNELKSGCDCAVVKCFESGVHQKAEHTHYDRLGNPVYVEVNAYPLKDASGNTVSAVETMMDITERKSIEAKLRHAQKMESVGILAGGIAHDFNNILTAIIGYGALTLKKMNPDDTSRHFVDNILTSAHRAADLTTGLLAFSRKQVINLQPLRLSEIVGRFLGFLSRIYDDTIVIKTTLSPQEAAVMADSGQIEQVLMNLALNARDAMPQGGTLEIATAVVDMDDEYVKHHAYAKKGRYMLITVADTGTGMDEKTREKIFDPFFTTKDVGKGTGLGLAIVYGIVKQHNGFITCYSEMGRGTTFKIYFPFADQMAVGINTEALLPIVGGSETILLADDESSVRDSTRKILEEFGYTVIAAENGEDALTKFKAHESTIDLLLLDVMMPRKIGKEVYEEILNNSPGTQALFMSGYTPDAVQLKDILTSEMELITKPFSPRVLLRKIRESLDARARPGK